MACCETWLWLGVAQSQQICDREIMLKYKDTLTITTCRLALLSIIVSLLPPSLRGRFLIIILEYSTRRH